MISFIFVIFESNKSKKWVTNQHFSWTLNIEMISKMLIKDNRFIIHFLIEKKLQLIKKHSHSTMDDIKDSIIQISKDESSLAVNLIRNSLYGGFLGLAAGPTYALTKLNFNFDRIRDIKIGVMFKRMPFKALAYSLKMIAPPVMAGAALGFSYTLFFSGFWNNIHFESDRVRVVLGHTLFSTAVGSVAMIHYLSRFVFIGFSVGVLTYFIQNRRLNPQLGLIYLPTDNPEIIEARKKAKEREIIHSMSIDLLTKMEKIHPDSGKFE